MRKTNEALKSLAYLIKKESNFILTTHTQPDGDALGSLLGLGIFLKGLGKRVWWGWNKKVKIPSHYTFLPEINSLYEPQEYNSPFCFIVLDCPNLKRICCKTELVEQAKVIVDIDHHPFNEMFGDINLVDERASSCAELVFRITKALDKKLNLDIATCLYVGLVTDTGRFQYSNTSKEAFAMAKELLSYGVVPQHIFHKIYESFSLNGLRFAGKIFTRAELVPELKLVYSYITQDDLSNSGIGMEDTENFIDYLRSVKDAGIAAIFKETRGGKVRVSLRSKYEINVEIVARELGGGGHFNAAGYTSQKGIKESLKELIRVLKDKREAVYGTCD